MNPWGINTFWNFWKIDIRNCRRTPRRNSWRFLEGTPVVLFRINLKNVPRRFMDGFIVGTLERIYGCIPSKTRAVIARDSSGDSQNDLRAFASLAVRNPRGIPLRIVRDWNSLCNFRFYFLRNPGRNSWEHPGRYSSKNHRKNSREIPEEKKWKSSRSNFFKTPKPQWNLLEFRKSKRDFFRNPSRQYFFRFRNKSST